MRGLLVVMSGPGGAGEDTLIEMLREHDRGLAHPVSYTTRPRRDDEVDGEHYRFVDETDFRRLDAEGELLEHARVNGHLYGTPAGRVSEALAAGRDVVLELDVGGAEQVRRRRPDALLICIEAPAMGPRRRLAGVEAADAPPCDHVVVNEDARRAAAEIRRILERERGRAGCACGSPPSQPSHAQPEGAG
ncbi:MAG TPA: guanylate kinase [Candidatus Eisenbacteria bacterium]|nr:guanylate kinase [Candidatus Eisenbacteria bacterium]